MELEALDCIAAFLGNGCGSLLRAEVFSAQERLRFDLWFSYFSLMNLSFSFCSLYSNGANFAFRSFTILSTQLICSSKLSAIVYQFCGKRAVMISLQSSEMLRHQ